ncbi:Glu-tRNA(Gln) amidotransferase subunit GatE [Candidatus Woesearchaeota archaeon]|nr:Glu-tRNA(Gln) amidotransferase subunit GatE [Candidatus Woesearchaeota archaeon]
MDKKALDYKKLGLKCGLEIHQQLDTKKLFCSCDSMIKEDEPDFSIKRNLRAVAGESGSIDIAAELEQKKEKHFIYQGYDDATCLVELDEEPPHEMNKEALKIVLQLAKIFKCKIIDQINVMRKTVVDGSNTTGFQRTSLIALNGKIPGSDIGIETICLEEDAARIIENRTDSTVYRLDRLGIPLIEIVTEPKIHTPEQCKKIAEKIGMILRSTKKVKRGLGTIRQDVNVSIKKGARSEIKGCQDLKLLPKIVEYEAVRQLSLSNIYEELKESNAECMKEKHDLTKLFRKTSSKVLKRILEREGRIYGIKMKNFAGFLGQEIQPNRRYGTELSDHAKLYGVNGLLHSDELPEYGITEKEVENVREKLNCNERDAFILIAGNENKVKKALDVVIEKANNLNVEGGVRKANPDGSSSYLRPLPGSARMYPETDIPEIEITKKILDSVKIPELLSEKTKTLEKYGLNKNIAGKIAYQKEYFEGLFRKLKNLKPGFIVDTFLSKRNELKKEYDINKENITDEHIETALGLIDKGKIAKNHINRALADIVKGKFNIKDYETIDSKKLENEIKNMIKNNPGLSKGAYMGMIMKKFKGKASGKEAMEILNKILK